mmetsp:Transcript_41654/g.75608  ORF Transcript_41654/g.75608 Transcript_41654/m.75608 type:complete len:85 (+) Transcript_41654:1133-1387(+)
MYTGPTLSSISALRNACDFLHHPAFVPVGATGKWDVDETSFITTFSMDNRRLGRRSGIQQHEIWLHVYVLAARCTHQAPPAATT